MSWDQSDFSLIKEIHLRLEVTEETHWFRSLLKQIVSWWILKRILNVESCDFTVTPAFSTVPSDIRYFEILSTYFHNFSTPPSCIFFFGLPLMFPQMQLCCWHRVVIAGVDISLQSWNTPLGTGHGSFPHVYPSALGLRSIPVSSTTVLVKCTAGTFWLNFLTGHYDFSASVEKWLISGKSSSMHTPVL